MAPDGITNYSHQALPQCSPVSSSSSLHCAHILLLLFIFHFSIIYSLLFVLPMASDCLGSPEECSQEYYAPLVHYGTRQGYSQV